MRDVSAICVPHRRAAAYCLLPTAYCLLQQPLIKRLRKQLAQTMPSCFALEIGQNDLQVPAEFPHDLPARPARWRWLVRLAHDDDAPEPAVTVGQRLEHRDALGADSQAVG